MPYIKQELRPNILAKVKALNEAIHSPGELNYAITCLIYLQAQDKLNYSKINELMGVLSCVQAEFYRMIAAEYENGKLSKNGPVVIRGDKC